MDINAILDASNIINQWKSSNDHVAPWTESQILDIVQTSDFQSWFSNNPNGTIDQYYIYICNRNAYLNSPQYKIKNLEAQIDDLTDEVESLNTEVSQLREEISDKEDEVSNLETINNVTITSSVILLIITCILFYKLRKRKK